MTDSVFMIEMLTDYQWDPLPEGSFDTEQAALAAIEELAKLPEWDADRLRVVEYTGEKADAYRQ